MFDLRYMYNATVTGVGAGFVNADGKTLRTIGNLPVKVGDTVYTDGRIAYGHVPVREQSLTVNKTKGIPYISYTSTSNGALSLAGTKIQKVDKYQDFHSKPSNWCYTYKGNFYTYWMQSANPSAQKFDTDDSSFYLDMRVTDSAVYTAEYTNADLQFQGQSATPLAQNIGDTTFYAVNFYLSESGGYTPDNPQFDFNWFQHDYPEKGQGGQVYFNCGIRIRRNGQATQVIDLSEYQFALDTVKEYYASYDTYDGELKRYHLKASFPRGASEPITYENIDIQVSSLLTQCLHFHFTDDDGNWEMIICSKAEATLNPHTIDIEDKEEDGEGEGGEGEGGEEVQSVFSSKTKATFNPYTIGAEGEEGGGGEDEEEKEEVQSVFSFDIPMVYYIVRVKSNGASEVLQSRIIVRKYDNNLVDVQGKSDWVNAKEYPIEEIDEKNLNSFWINFDNNCGYETDLSAIRSVKIYGAVEDIKGYIPSFLYLIAANYHDLSPYGGATQSFIAYDLRRNYSEYVLSTPRHEGFVSGEGYGVKRNASIQRAYFNTDGNSYIGKMSVLETVNKYIVAIYGVEIIVIDKDNKKVSSFGSYNYNMNLDVLRDIRKLKRPRTINDLVADVTKPKNS